MEVISDPKGRQQIRLTDEEQKLVEKARKALAPINFYPAGHVVAALIYTGSRPIGLDFKAYIPGTIGQAFIAPTPRPDLTEDMFEGESLAPRFHEQLKAWVREYEAYWQEYEASSKQKSRSS